MLRIIDTLNKLFPHSSVLRDRVLESLKVPQVGDHHNEGPFMFAHLDLALRTLEDVREGKFLPEVPQAVRGVLSRAAGNRERAWMFCLFHDNAKMDCMTLQMSNGSCQAVSWQEWQALLPEKFPSMDQLHRVIRERGITKIQYFQEFPAGTVKHGDMGAYWLRKHGGTDEVLLFAIEEHEVTMSFDTILVDTWRRHFGNKDSETQDFVLLANYLDAAASLNKDGNPDLGGFVNMARSWETSEALRAVEKALANAPVDKNLLTRKLSEAKKQYVSLEEVPVLTETLRKACRVASYVPEKLQAGLDSLVSSGKLTQEEAKLVFNAMMDPAGGLSVVGKALSKKMGLLRPVLDAAKEV